MSNAASLRKWVVENKIGSVGTFLCPYSAYSFSFSVLFCSSDFEYSFLFVCFLFCLVDES